MVPDGLIIFLNHCFTNVPFWQMKGNYWSIKTLLHKKRISSPCNTVPHKVRKCFNVCLNLFQVFWVYLPLRVSVKGRMLASSRSKHKWNKAFGRSLANLLTWIPFCEAFRTGNIFWLYVFIVYLFNTTQADSFYGAKICKWLQCYLCRERDRSWPVKKEYLCSTQLIFFFISSMWILSCLITTYNRLDWIGKWNTFVFQNLFRNGCWRHTHTIPEQSQNLQPQPTYFLSHFGGSFCSKDFFLDLRKCQAPID